MDNGEYSTAEPPNLQSGPPPMPSLGGAPSGYGGNARSTNRHLYPPRSASPAKALPPISRHPYPRGFAAGVLSPHHPARADIDDDGGGGQAGAGRRSRSRGICGGMAPALRRLAGRAPWRSVGQSEGNQPVGRSPVQKACPLRGFPPDKREGHRGIRLPAMGTSGGSCGLTSK